MVYFNSTQLNSTRFTNDTHGIISETNTDTVMGTDTGIGTGSGAGIDRHGIQNRRSFWR